MDRYDIRGSAGKIGSLLESEFDHTRRQLELIRKEIQSATGNDYYYKQRLADLETKTLVFEKFCNTLIALLPALAPVLEQSIKAINDQLEQEEFEANYG